MVYYDPGIFITNT